MTLTLGGKPFSLVRPSPSVEKVKAVLGKQPKDQLYYSRDIAKLAGVAAHYLAAIALHPDLADYTEKPIKERVFGHPAAIKELRRQLGREK